MTSPPPTLTTPLHLQVAKQTPCGRGSSADWPGPQSKQIFDASAGEKQRCSIKNNRGWAGMHVEALDPKNQKVRVCFALPSIPVLFKMPCPDMSCISLAISKSEESFIVVVPSTKTGRRLTTTCPRAFNFGEFVDAKARQPLPSTVAHEEPHFSAFADSCRSLCHKILYLLGLGLHVSGRASSPAPPRLPFIHA